ncbi:Uncharacterised protein [Mycoplasmopsis gallinacea]|uniref:ABC transporter permease n=1 Tax=Mycoplasmopsis gallinacea TaxID=29556 RepID=A0A449A3S8_9BACT|nr:Uncharacterised protein [Mycoplasmopsis gallinacea]
MLSFLKLQLKIYFRQFSTYIVPLVLALIIFFYRLVFYWSGKTPEDSKVLLSLISISFYYGLLVFLAVFISVAFSGTTFFYKYKNEGIGTILYSKPISKHQIFWTNWLCILIGSVFCLVFINIANLLSLFAVNLYTVKEVFSIFASVLLASFLFSLLAIGFASFVHNFVQLKTFQIIVGIVPFILIFIFSAMKLNVVKSEINFIPKLKNKATIILRDNSANKKDYFKDIQNNFGSNNEVLAFDKNTEDLFGNYNYQNGNFKLEDIKAKDISLLDDFLNNYNDDSNLYNKLEYLNFGEYFYQIISSFNREIFPPETKWEYSKNVSLEKVTNANSDSPTIIMPFYDVKSGKLIEIALNWDLSLVRSFMNLNSEPVSTATYYSNLLNFDFFNNFNYLNLFNNEMFNLVTSWRKKVNLNENETLVSSEVSNLENKHFVNVENIPNFANLLLSDETISKRIEQVVSLIKQDKSKNPFKNYYGNFSSSNSSLVSHDFYVDLFRKLLKNTLVTLAVSLEMKNENLVFDLEKTNQMILESDNLDFVQFYKLNSLKPFVIKDNLIAFKRVAKNNVYIAFLVPFSIFTLFTLVGWISFVKKEYN